MSLAGTRRGTEAAAAIVVGGTGDVSAGAVVVGGWGSSMYQYAYEGPTTPRQRKARRYTARPSPAQVRGAGRMCACSRAHRTRTGRATT
jgi:hypothetical protein